MVFPPFVSNPIKKSKLNIKVMAKKKSINNRKESAKKVAANLDQNILKASEAILTVSMEVGKKWHNLIKQTITVTEPMREKQIDMFFDTTEAVVTQVEEGAEKFKDLLGIEEPIGDIVKKRFNTERISTKLQKNASKLVSIVTATGLKEKIEQGAIKLKMEVSERFNIAEGKVTRKAPKKTKAKAKAKKATTKVAKPTVKKSRKAVAKKSTSKKVVTKKVVAKKASSVKDDLTKIYGIGPKMEKILNARGYLTYNDLKAVTAKDLQAIINNSGGAYKSYKAGKWIKQASVASKGDLKKLTEWINDNVKK